MPTITLPLPVHELLAVLPQATAQGQDIREMVVEAALQNNVRQMPPHPPLSSVPVI